MSSTRLNAASGLRAPTSTAPAEAESWRRPERRPELAEIDPSLQLRRATATKEGRPAAVSDLAVEKHRELEPPPPPAGRPRARRRGRDPWSAADKPTSGTMSAAPTRGWIPVCRRRSMCSAAARDACDERLDEQIVVGEQRVNRTVMVAIGVRIDHARTRVRIRARNGLDDRRVASLGDVRHGLQRGHRNTLRACASRLHRCTTTVAPRSTTTGTRASGSSRGAIGRASPTSSTA